jgi:hypothetical protein
MVDLMVGMKVVLLVAMKAAMLVETLAASTAGSKDLMGLQSVAC